MKKCAVLIQISLKSVSKGPINHKYSHITRLQCVIEINSHAVIFDYIHNMQDSTLYISSYIYDDIYIA